MSDSALCKKCRSKQVMERTTPEQNRAKVNRFLARKAQRAADAFDAWLSKVNKVPKPFKVITEQEWLQACVAFGRCATCGNESIDARAFFIPFAFGGKYAAWNVIPVCDRCATSLKRQRNPFIRYESGIIDPIVEYLQPILEEAIK